MSKTVASITADIAAEPPLEPAVSTDAPLFVGIDIAKNAHVGAFVSASLIAKHGRFEKCPVLVFENTRSGFEKLFTVMTQHAPTSQCSVLVEHTGVFGNALEAYLLERGVKIFKMFVRARPQSHQKSDKRDALSLANQLYNQLAKGIQIDDRTRKIRPVTPPNTTALRLRGLVQRAYELSIEVARTKNKLIAICDEVFPELTQIYKNPNSPSALNLRETFPTPEQIAAASLPALYATRKRNKPSNRQFKELQDVARQSIGTTNTDRLFGLVLEQSQLIKELRLLEEHQATIDEAIEKLTRQSRQGQILLSIKGVGIDCASTALAVIGDIRNFESDAKLKAYFGYAPELVQTGVSKNSEFQALSGARLAKRALYLAVLTATHYPSAWKALYDRLVPKKCSYDERTRKWRGKMKVIGRVAGQMIEMIFRLLKQDADLLASIPPGTEPPPPQLYDEAKHLSAMTRPRKKHVHVEESETPKPCILAGS